MSSNFAEYVCAIFDFYNDIMYNPINTACRDMKPSDFHFKCQNIYNYGQ